MHTVLTTQTDPIITHTVYKLTLTMVALFLGSTVRSRSSLTTCNTSITHNKRWTRSQRNATQEKQTNH